MKKIYVCPLFCQKATLKVIPTEIQVENDPSKQIKKSDYLQILKTIYVQIGILFSSKFSFGPFSPKV
jgi:predicted subunit of tRNA(5-methylaminomethyl-2-thiouridylate) methyltransferase